MNNTEPGPTVLNIASVCPRCQTVFTHEAAADLRTAIERAEKAEAACAEMQRVLESWKDYFQMSQGSTREVLENQGEAFTTAWFDTERALSSDCGKGWVRDEDCQLALKARIKYLLETSVLKSELDKTIEALKLARRAMEWYGWNKCSDHDYLEFKAVRAVNDDIFRLESLRKESTK